jgi:hypothetical protein
VPRPPSSAVVALHPFQRDEQRFQAFDQQFLPEKRVGAGAEQGSRSIAMSRSENPRIEPASSFALTLAGQAVSFGAISRKSLNVR